MSTPPKFIAVDPGEDTGWSVWENGELVDGGQLPLKKFIAAVWDSTESREAYLGTEPDLIELMKGWKIIVCESFRLYPWAAEALVWDSLRTSQGIGALKLIARITGRQFVEQEAKIKDAAEAAGAAEFFRYPLHANRHFCDSARHGVWYILQHDKAQNSPSIK